MDLALYHPDLGYYARASVRSGREGDFFTSVDVGSLFGELLETQIAEMADLVARDGAVDLVEVGAGNGRLTADVLRAARTAHPTLYGRLRAHLVERSAPARAAHATVLADVADRMTTSSAALPIRFEGVVFANELLDALPVHQVVMRESGLREMYVESDGTTLRTIEGPLSTPRLASYFEDLAIVLEPGWRAEVNLQAVDWIADLAERLTRGFVILVDYGHEAQELYSAGHAGGTLTAARRHTSAGPEARAAQPAWLDHPGEVDLTAHVDFTSVGRAGTQAGLSLVGLLDQTYFLMGLIGRTQLGPGAGVGPDLKRRLTLKTLVLPGGLGSTFKVLIFSKDVEVPMSPDGKPTLGGLSYRVRVT